MSGLPSPLSDAKIMALIVTGAAVVALALLLRHEVVANGALRQTLTTAEQAARNNADAVRRVRADAQRDMAVLEAQRTSEATRAAQVITITKVVHDAPKDPYCEDRVVLPGSAGDRAYRCLFDSGSCAAGVGDSGNGARSAR